MNKFIHTTIKLSFLSVIISMAALLNTAPTAGATTQTAHNGQSVVDNRLILNPEIGERGHGQQPGADIGLHLARHVS